MLHSEAAEWSLFWLPPSDEQSAFIHLCRWFGFCFFSGKFPRDRPQFIVILIRRTRGRGACTTIPQFCFWAISAMLNHIEMTKFSCVCQFGWVGSRRTMSAGQKYFNGTRKFAMTRSSLHCELNEFYFGLIHRNEHLKGGNICETQLNRIGTHKNKQTKHYLFKNSCFYYF